MTGTLIKKINHANLPGTYVQFPELEKKKYKKEEETCI